MRTVSRLTTTASCLAILCSTLAFGQIFISPDDFPNVTGMTLTYYTNVTNNVLVNVGNAGANQTWDFTVGPEEQEVQEQIIRASESPYYEQFPEANRVRVSDTNLFGIPGTAYTHRRMTNEQLTLLGIGADVGGYPMPIRLGENGLQEYPMPLYYEDAWDNTIVLDTIFTIANPDTTIPLDSLDVRLELTLGDQAVVDAWGTLAGPLGSNPVLRVRHDTGIEATVSVWLIIFWVPVWDTTYAQIRYEWLAQDSGPIVTVASHAGETNPNFDQASRVQRLFDMSTNVPSAPSVPLPLTITLLPNYPNPFNESTVLAFSLPSGTADKAALIIYNVLGQKIVTLWEGAADGGTHYVIWNGRNAQSMPVASGTYFATLRTGRNIRTLPIIKLD